MKRTIWAFLFLLCMIAAFCVPRLLLYIYADSKKEVTSSAELFRINDNSSVIDKLLLMSSPGTMFTQLNMDFNQDEIIKKYFQERNKLFEFGVLSEKTKLMFDEITNELKKEYMSLFYVSALLVINNSSNSGEIALIYQVNDPYFEGAAFFDAENEKILQIDIQNSHFVEAEQDYMFRNSRRPSENVPEQLRAWANYFGLTLDEVLLNPKLEGETLPPNTKSDSSLGPTAAGKMTAEHKSVYFCLTTTTDYSGTICWSAANVQDVFQGIRTDNVVKN